METKKKQLGLRVRLFRTRAGIAQNKFALMIGMNQSYLSGIENGRRNVSFENICKIAEGLNVTLEELFKGL